MAFIDILANIISRYRSRKYIVSSTKTSNLTSSQLARFIALIVL